MTTAHPAPAYRADIADFGALALTEVDPEWDAALLHRWVTEPRARFWGMSDYSVDQVREVYAYLDSLDTHHAYLIWLDSTPVGLVQTYDPASDPVGERYTVQPGDIGIHLLLVPGRRPPRGLTHAVGTALVRFVFRDPSRQRIVVEPDVRNQLALRRAAAFGFTFGDEIDLPDKRAQLAFLYRERGAAT